MTKYILTNYSENQSTYAAPVSSSGVVESGVVGSGVIVSGLIDSGLVDSGLIDSGLIDSGLIDSGLVDSGIVDPNKGTTGSIIVSPGYQPGTEQTNDQRSDNNKNSEKDNSQTTGNPLLPDEKSSQSDDSSSHPGEKNPSNPSTSSGIVVYKDGIPIYSYETAIGLCRSGQWFGGYVIGVNPNDVNEIAYMYKENEVWAGAATSGKELLNRAYQFEGIPYKSGGFSSQGG